MRIKHEQLKRLRVQAGWTQEEIAAKCRIDVRTYRKYERGEVNRGLTGLDDFNRSDQYDVLARIAAALDLAAPDELIEKRGAAEDTPPGPGSPYHPSWYVHREAEERKALNRLRSAGAPVVLQGPWLYDKATLLGYLLERAAQPEGANEPAARTVRINLLDHRLRFPSPRSSVSTTWRCSCMALRAPSPASASSWASVRMSPERFPEPMITWVRRSW